MKPKTLMYRSGKRPGQREEETEVRKIQRVAAVGAAAALTVVLGACSSSEAPSTAAPAAPAAPSSSAAESSSAAPSSSATATGEGVTTIDDIFGPACSQVPTSGEGSAQGMVDDPVATAASNNPILTTLTAAVTGALNPGVNLVDTLNGGEFTVFAPVDDAFGKVDPATLETLKTDANLLTTILTYHVVPGRLTAMDLTAKIKAGGGKAMLKTAQGENLTVTAKGDMVMITDAKGGMSHVTVANVMQSNGVIHVVDTVLMP